MLTTNFLNFTQTTLGHIHNLQLTLVDPGSHDVSLHNTNTKVFPVKGNPLGNSATAITVEYFSMCEGMIVGGICYGCRHTAKFLLCKNIVVVVPIFCICMHVSTKENVHFFMAVYSLIHAQFGYSLFKGKERKEKTELLLYFCPTHGEH